MPRPFSGLFSHVPGAGLMANLALDNYKICRIYRINLVNPENRVTLSKAYSDDCEARQN